MGGGYFTKQLRDGRHKILELKEKNSTLGPSKNYVTARGGGGSNFFYIPLRYILRGGGILENCYITEYTKF